MIKGRETAVDTIVTVNADGMLAPCGRCRERLVQSNRDNFSAQVALPGNRVLLLRDLLPDHWMYDRG